MKIFIYTSEFHFKNLFFIEYFVNKYHERVYTIEDADIIYSAFQYIDIHNYPDKKFIFGPQFSVFPNNVVNQFNNINNNAIYIQPSQPSVDTWQNEFKFTKLPMKAIPFGVDTDRFKPSDNVEKNNVIVYYKQRDPNEYKLLLDFLNKKNINYRIFDYIKRYDENKFLSYLKTCKYGVILGRHESQGFAIQEMMSCDVPLLIWGVTLRKQEYPYIKEYQQIKSNVSTVPYWSNKCGEIFYKSCDIEKTYNIFVEKLDYYKPREFILENVSFEVCCNKWNKLLLSL
jgi:hypothetical protein